MLFYAVLYNKFFWAYAYYLKKDKHKKLQRNQRKTPLSITEQRGFYTTCIQQILIILIQASVEPGRSGMTEMTLDEESRKTVGSQTVKMVCMV